MALYLINGNRMRVHFQNHRTAILSYPAFPGGLVKNFQNDSVNLLIKEILSDLFAIRYKIFSFSQTQTIESVIDSTGLHSTVMLQNSLGLYINGTSHFQHKEGSISLFSGHVTGCSATLQPGHEYRALDVFAAEDLASRLIHFFPGISFNAHSLNNLLPFPCFISPALHRVIDQILDCPYDEATSPFYFDVKVREYFYLLLKECTGLKQLKYRFTPFEMDGLVQAREILLSDLTKPPLTIRQLAQKVSMNEFKLKAGFAQFFKTGVFECFQRARMYKAKQLLLQTNKPIKDICSMAGYPRMTNFITAFRKFFGKTPGSFRR